VVGGRWLETSGPMYSVTDEAQLGAPTWTVKTGLRVLRNCRPVYLFGQAKRTEIIELFRHAPLQSEFLPQPSAQNGNEATPAVWKLKFSLIERAFLKIISALFQWLCRRNESSS